MKKLNKEELIRLVPASGHTSKIRQHAFSLEKGETIFLPKSEWKSYRYSAKTTIGSLLYNKVKKFSAKQCSLDKVKGYGITRIH